MNLFTFTARHITLKIIKIYQKTISFDHGILSPFFPHGFCQFNPSCSEYSYQAIEKYGVIKGGAKTLWRVLRCNPLSKGGFDPLN